MALTMSMVQLWQKWKWLTMLTLWWCYHVYMSLVKQSVQIQNRIHLLYTIKWDNINMAYSAIFRSWSCVVMVFIFIVK